MPTVIIYQPTDDRWRTDLFNECQESNNKNTKDKRDGQIDRQITDLEKFVKNGII